MRRILRRENAARVNLPAHKAASGLRAAAAGKGLVLRAGRPCSAAGRRCEGVIRHGSGSDHIPGTGDSQKIQIAALPDLAGICRKTTFPIAK